MYILISQILLDVSAALVHCHQQEPKLVVHNDIAARNVLLDGDYHGKVRKDESLFHYPRIDCGTDGIPYL